MQSKCVPEKTAHWWGATCDDVCLKKYADCRLKEFEADVATRIETGVVTRLQPTVAGELVKNDRFTSNVANAVGKDNYTTRQIAKSVCSADDCTLLTPTIQRVAKPYIEAAVAPALQPLVADVAAVKKDLGGLRADVTTAKAESVAASKKADDSKSSGIATTISMLKKVSEGVSKQLKEAEASTSATVTSLSKSLNKLGTDVSTRIKAQQSAIDGHTKSLKALDDKMLANLATIGQESKRRVEDVAKSLDSKITSVTSDLTNTRNFIRENVYVRGERGKKQHVMHCEGREIGQGGDCRQSVDAINRRGLHNVVRCAAGYEVVDLGPQFSHGFNGDHRIVCHKMRRADEVLLVPKMPRS